MVASGALFAQQHFVLRQQFLVAYADLLVTLQALMRQIQRRLARGVGHPDRTGCKRQDRNYRGNEKTDGELSLLLVIDLFDHCDPSPISLRCLTTLAERWKRA